MKLNTLQAQIANKRKARCLATIEGHICHRELGHGRGWNHSKHDDGKGFSWTDAYAVRRLKELASEGPKI